MQKKTKWLLIAAVSVCGLCLLGCLGMGVAIRFAPNIYQYSLDNSSLKIGDAAPDFKLSALTGETMRLSQFRGQPVLVSFGATWCPDCRNESPLLEVIHKSHPKLIILLVDSKEAPKIVQRFADELDITHPILLDRDGKVSELYKIFAIPTELFIGSDGIIHAKIVEKVTSQLLAENLLQIGVEP